MSRVTMINPAELGAPRGYSNGILAPAGGRLLFVAGQIGWNSEQKLVGEDFSRQFAQALANVASVVRAASGDPQDVCRLTIYVTDRREYIAALKEVGAAYRDIFGRHFPAMALLQVSALLELGAKVEIEATAVVPSEEES